MAKIQLNGKKITVKQKVSLFDLLKKYQLDKKKVAIELNVEIVDKKISVRKAEILVKKIKNKGISKIKSKDINIVELEKKLEEKTGLFTTIKNSKGNKGTISFKYTELDQLDKLVNLIKNNY